MSIQTWKDEFYTPPEDCGEDELLGLKQAERKYTGALPENLEKHSLRVARVKVVPLIEDSESWFRAFGENECALCQIYVTCRGCPLVIIDVNDGLAVRCGDTPHPYMHFVGSGDPKPLLDLIRKKIKELEK